MKILYIMHVDWNWIKQRPHFIAEGLAEVGHDVDVFYPYSKNRKVMTNNKTTTISRLVSYFRFPYRLRNFPLMSYLSQSLTKLQFPKESYDAIYLTYPEQIHWVPKGFKGKIFYDCMDDHSEFENIDKDKIYVDEKTLCNIADKIIASSDNLKEILRNKYNLDENNIYVVKNGLSTSLNLNGIYESKGFNKKIVYLGTISEWIDFDVIKLLLDTFDDITIDFIGPVTVPVIEHERLIFRGAVNHNELDKIMTQYGCYIMPFKVNDLIKSVDPVKLYEYIFFGGNVVSCYYLEIDRFSKFVNFYQNGSDLCDLIRDIKNGNIGVQDLNKRREFLKDNTWNSRVKKINELL